MQPFRSDNSADPCHESWPQANSMKKLLIIMMILLKCIMTQPQANFTVTTATLSEARWDIAAAALGDLVFCGGGPNGPGQPCDHVEICNVTRGSWATATLSSSRSELAAASAGNVVLFGGGRTLTEDSNTVDVYNVASNTWQVVTLSQARYGLAATSVGNIILFGGGYNAMFSFMSNVVDIYNVTSNMWTNASLSQARYYLSATSVANRYALFAGGINNTGSSNVVDIYDVEKETWSTATLSQARFYIAAASLSNWAFFGGGQDSNYGYSNVDVFDSTTLSWNTMNLNRTRSHAAAAAAVDIVAFGGGADYGVLLSSVEIFNVTSNSWTTSANLSDAEFGLAAVSSTNRILFAGGTNGIFAFNFVDIFEVTTASSSTPPSVSSTPSLPSPTSQQQMPSSPSSFVPSNTLAPSSSALTPSPTTVSTPPQSFIPSNNIGTLTPSGPSASVGLIVGLTLGIGVVIIGLILAVLFVLKKRQKKQMSGTTAEPSATSAQDDDQTTTNYFPISQKGLTKSLNQIASKDRFIDFKELKLSTEIGKGAYGVVMLGTWRSTRVAVKLCKNVQNQNEFVKEALLMTDLRPHPNLVQMLGVSVNGNFPAIVMEFCPGGSLDKFLANKNNSLSRKEQFKLVKGIAAGMLHLHLSNIVHRDLAARNVLLGEGNVPKLSDFGMSRVMSLGEDEQHTQNTFGPIRWMAPESFKNPVVYSKMSDVWSFGIVVYEIVSRQIPHQHEDTIDLAVQIRDKGKTPIIPEDCDPLLKKLMLACWQFDPRQRPTFEQIVKMIEAEDDN
jgi:predicted Ser/Thr protein kinase